MTKEREEAIVKLELAENLLKTSAFMESSDADNCLEYVDQALTLLKEPKCKTCGDIKRVHKPMPNEPHPCTDVNLMQAERTIPCPDCQQPPAGEFTKWVRENYTETGVCGRIIRELSARLDTSEAKLKTLETINADLLAVCEDTLPALEKIRKTQKIDPFYLETLITINEVAITKAKKG